MPSPARIAKRHDDDHSSLSYLLPQMTASALSGMLARIPMHPVDTVKAKMQVQTFSNTQYKNAAEALWKTFRHEGLLRGLYPGFGVTFIGSAPAACLYFTSFEYSRIYLKESSPFIARHPFIADFCSGLLAEVFSCIAWVPIDVVKERLQVQSGMVSDPSLRYKGNIDALKTILRTEGIRGIYRGYGATVASFGPFSALYLMFYESFKRFSIKRHGVESARELPFHSHILSGAAAGAVASFLTNPLDMAKLRMQVQRGKMVKALSFNYRNVVDGVHKIFVHEGFSGLFKGAGARMAFHAPSVAITITAYEECKKLLKI